MLPDISKFIINEEDNVKKALEVINENGQGICFIINSFGKLTGVLTDGDIRRAFLSKKYSMDTSVHNIMQKNFLYHFVNESDEILQKSLSKKIKYIPLVDNEIKPVDYACLYKLRKIPIMEPYLEGNELAYLTQCIKTNWISSKGPFVNKFEEIFAKICDTKYVLATTSGTTALHLGLLSLQIEKESEVILPNLTFAASINVIIQANLKPVLVDIDKDTWTIDTQKLKKHINSKTKAIMPVHLYGYPCNMGEILKIAKENELYIIEDCAEALGSKYYGKNVGSFGDVSCFSFFGNKTITTGEGGIVALKRKENYEYAKILRDHGMDPNRKYWHINIGYNYRMTNMQAAVGVAQMENFERIIIKKRKIASLYKKYLKDLDGIVLPMERKGFFNTFWLYTILITDNFGINRDDVILKLQLKGVETRPVFYPLSEMPPYKSYILNEDFKISMTISKQGISLPSSINLSEKEVKEICYLLKRIKDGVEV